VRQQERKRVLEEQQQQGGDASPGAATPDQGRKKRKKKGKALGAGLEGLAPFLALPADNADEGPENRLGELADAAAGVAGAGATPGSLPESAARGGGSGQDQGLGAGGLGGEPQRKQRQQQCIRQQQQHESGHHHQQQEWKQQQPPRVKTKGGKEVPLKFPAWSSGWGSRVQGAAAAAMARLRGKAEAAVAAAALVSPAYELLACLGRTTTLPIGTATTADGNCGFNAVSQHQEIVAEGGYRVPSSSESQLLKHWEHRHAQLRGAMCDMVESSAQVQQLIGTWKWLDDAQLCARLRGSGAAIKQLLKEDAQLSLAHAYARVMRAPVAPGKYSHCLDASLFLLHIMSASCAWKAAWAQRASSLAMARCQ
jgi:hypothetical protein